MPAAAILSAGASLIGQGINYFGQKARQRSEFKENRKQSEKAYGHDIDMWNRQSNWNREQWDLQNEYNLPANQMQRLRDAGLNPNLAAGGGSAGGSAGTVQKAEMPKYSAARANYQQQTPLKMPDLLGIYNNFRLQNAQVDHVKAQTEVAKESALTEAALRVHRKDGAFADATTKYANAKYAESFKDLEYKQMQQAYETGKAQKGLKEHELKWMRDFGMRPGDPLQVRWMMRLMDKFGMGDLVK